jgi:hypothetical protein
LETVEAAPSKALQTKNKPGKSRAAKSKSKKTKKARKNKGRKRNGEDNEESEVTEGGELELTTQNPDIGGELETDEPDVTDPEEGGGCMQCFDP